VMKVGLGDKMALVASITVEFWPWASDAVNMQRMTIARS